MARKGRHLEEITHALEKYLAGSGAIVESPGFVEDRITGQMREVDVLITRGQGHHKQVIAVECRDRKAPVGNPDIEAFHTKTSDLKINKAVFVSASGFRQKAIKKAQFYNISCLDLDEIAGFEWLATDHVEYRETKLLKVNWQINTNDKAVSGRDTLVVRERSGTTITNEILAANANRLLNSLDLTWCQSGTVYGHTFSLSPDNIMIIDEATGTEYAVSECKVYVEFQQLVQELPLKRIRYGDITEGTNIANVAVADVSTGKINGHMMMVEQQDGSTHVVFVPKKNL